MHSGKIDLWQGCHKMGEKSSIVPLGAPLSPVVRLRLGRINIAIVSPVISCISCKSDFQGRGWPNAAATQALSDKRAGPTSL
jgi:hypothetical protein